MSILSFIKGKASGAANTSPTTETTPRAEAPNTDKYHASEKRAEVGTIAFSPDPSLIDGISGVLDMGREAHVRGRRYDPGFAAEHKDQLRNTLETPRVVTSIDLPEVPHFQEFVQLDLESFRDPDPNVRRSTVDSIEQYYMNKRDEIYMRINQAQSQSYSTNINEAKLGIKTIEAMQERLFLLERELENLQAFREHGL